MFLIVITSNGKKYIKTNYKYKNKLFFLKMFLFVVLLFLFDVASSCVWHRTETIFPEHLVFFHASNLYNTSHGVLSGGLLKDGSMHHAIMFNSSLALPDMTYAVENVLPGPYRAVVDVIDEPNPVIVRIPHYLDAIFHHDLITIEIAAYSPCLPNRIYAKVPYTINITSNYHLTHCFDIPNASWSDKGWVYDPNLILHPQLMYEHHFHSRKNTTIRVSDCLYYKIVPWMRILNASTFTTWSVSERSYDVDFKFVHGEVRPARCHRYWMGSVCVVEAGVRMIKVDTCLIKSHRDFTLQHAVSQYVRFGPIKSSNLNWPTSFDVTRRLPVRDGIDMRYDLCRSSISSSGINNREENLELQFDGDISIRQRDFANISYIETVCRFDVVGFLDDLWSPLLYFRHWYTYSF